MVKLPYISIVVCIYNGEKTLSLAIESLLNQKYPSDKYEIILINDGSTDSSEIICIETINEWHENLPTIKYTYQENRGLSSARNMGVYLSGGDYIVFIDQDAVANSDWLSHLMQAFDDSEKIGVVGGKIKILNNNSWFANFIQWVHYYMEDSKGHEIIPIVGTNMAFKRSVFKKVGGFFENFRGFGDETSFINVKVKPLFEMNTSDKAIVLHERPWDLKQWLRERTLNGREYALERYIAKKFLNKTKYNCLYNFYRITSTMLPLFVILALLTDNKMIIVIAISAGVLILYRCYIRDNVFIRTKIIVKKYGIFQGICLMPLYIIINLIGKYSDDCGFVMGLIKYRSVAVRDSVFVDKIETIMRRVPPVKPGA